MSVLEKPPYSDEFYEVMLENESTLQNEFGITDVKVCHLKNSSLVVAYIPADVYRRVISQRGSFEGALLAGAPIIMGLTDAELNSAIDVYRLRDSPIDLRGQNTIIGIVDTGIDYKNEEFIREDGTSRILNIWDMTIDSDDDNVCFGTEFSNKELTEQSADTTDEVGHGTRMAQVAGGRSGVAPDCEFIVVKLKRAKKSILDLYGLNSDTESYESSDVVLGIDYLVTKSIEYRKPISIILGLGTNQGGHDGLTVIERILSQMALRIGVGISVSAGNEALSGHHTSFTLEGSSPYYDMEINVANNEKSFPVWIWNSLFSEIEVSIISPLGEETGRIPTRNNFTNTYNFNISLTSVRVSYELPASWGRDQRTTLVFNNPIEGVWKIRVYNIGVTGVVNSWLPSNGFIKRDTRFLNPDPYITVTVPSTANYIMCVGAFDPSTKTVYSTSGRGTTRQGIVLPSFVAPSDGSTSIATAVNGGATALILEWGLNRINNLNINSLAILEYITRSATKKLEDIYPNTISGYGRLNIFNAIASI